jgi:hypothetical protein
VVATVVAVARFVCTGQEAIVTATLTHPVPYAIREVNVATIKRAPRGKWHDMAKELLLRLQATSPGKALELTFGDETTALNAAVGIRKALKQFGKQSQVQLTRMGRIVYMAHAQKGNS